MIQTVCQRGHHSNSLKKTEQPVAVDSVDALAKKATLLLLLYYGKAAVIQQMQ